MIAISFIKTYFNAIGNTRAVTMGSVHLIEQNRISARFNRIYSPIGSGYKGVQDMQATLQRAAVLPAALSRTEGGSCHFREHFKVRC